MSPGTIEERIARLEEMMDRLMQTGSVPTQPSRDDWRRTFGMFAGDPVMKEIIEAGNRLREEDRRNPSP
ncbi:MAG: hypothetical protein JSS02_06920 [Planctomycetes bacterium]|nr:hypothetical protein [Planctomycetota bacterium]